MKFFKETLSRHVAILTVGIFIAFIGVKSLLSMPRSLFPTLNYPRVLVEVNMGYAPLQVMEWSVTAVLEKQLRAIPGVRIVKSNSSRGNSTINVFLDEKQDVTRGVQRVNAKISETRSSLPPSVQISVRPITAAAFAAGEFCFTSDTKSMRQLRTFVEYTVKPQIMVIPGLFDTKVYGGDQPEMSVELDPNKLDQYNLSVAEINDRLKNSNGVDFLGPINTANSQILAFGGRFVRTPEDIGNIVVASRLGNPIYIHDLGTVRLANQWKRNDSSLDGRSCVGLDVYYQGGIDQKKVADAVALKVKEIIKKNEGDHYRSWDLNEFTDAATNAVLLDLGIGMLIIALVTLIFLRNFKYSLVALLSMPLAACLTFLIMSALGMSINLMTLGGLTAAIGLVVDNTVIVLEMYHHRKSIEVGKSRLQFLHETLVSVAKPMIFGTATIALVFTPISYLSGVSGMFFAPMAHVHTSALVVSVFLALFIVPGLVLLFDRSKKIENNSRHSNFDDSKLARGYRLVLQWVLKRGKISTSFFLIIPLLGLFALPFAQTGFLPEWDEGDIVIDFRAMNPIGLESTINRIKPVEEFLNNEVPEIDFFIRKVGTGLGSHNKPPFVGEIIVKLKKDRQRSVFKIIENLSSKLTKIGDGLEFDLFQILPDRLNDLSGSAKPIVIHLRGDDKQLDKAAQAYKNSLAQIKGLASVRINEPSRADEYQLRINERKTRALGLNPNILDDDVRFAIFSLDSSFIQNGQQTIPIRLRSKLENRIKSSEIKLEDAPTFSNVGGLKKVGDIGSIRVVKSRVESEHIDGTPVRTVTAELAGTDLGSAVREIQKSLAKIDIPGVYAELAGDFVMQQKSFRQLIDAFLTGIALIFLTSLFFSNRLKVAIPLTAASLIPPIIGLVGCVVFNIPLDVSSFSGLISVTGIAVANSFMALSAIEDLPEFNTNYKMAILKGMLSRLRPILMTNLAAMAGFVPIAIGLAQGDEILRPFSIAIIVGLFGAIYTTLVVVPTFYFHFSKQKID